MRTVSCINLTGSQMPDNILCPKAISDSTNLFGSLLLQLFQGSLHNGSNLLNTMFGPPGAHIEVYRSIERNWVALEHIGHDDEIAIGGELVRDELGVDESVANDIGDDEDAVFGRLVGRIGEVCLDWMLSVFDYSSFWTPYFRQLSSFLH